MCYIWSESKCNLKVMKQCVLICILALAATACKPEDPMVKMADDVCACLMPTVEDGDKATEIIKRNNEAELAAFEAEMLKTQKETQACFQNLEKQYGNMQEFQVRVTEIMKKRCPRAAKLLSNTGG